MTKEYLRKTYRLAYLDYELATTDAERHEAMREMKSIECTASDLYGFDFADQLQELKTCAHNTITPYWGVIVLYIGYLT